MNEIISMRIEPSQPASVLSDYCRSCLDSAGPSAFSFLAFVAERERLCRIKGKVQIRKTLIAVYDAQQSVSAKGMFPE